MRERERERKRRASSNSLGNMREGKSSNNGTNEHCAF